MKITFFGIGSATPHLERNPSSCLVNLGNESILIDCGEGTQFRLLKYKVKHSRISKICITHLHGDHYFGLVGLLSSWNLSRRKQALTIYGPAGLEEIVKIQLEAGNSVFSFPIEFIVVNASEPSQLYNGETYTIESFPLSHRIPCTGFKVMTKNEKRKILADKLPKDFPIIYYKKLQNGEDVKDELSGEYFANSDYTTAGLVPKSFAYCSDTAYNTRLIPDISEVDILYHEATFGDELEDRAAMTLHSTARQAASIAAQANVKKLLIGHFSSRYKTLDSLLVQAQEVFPDTEIVEQAKEYVL